MALYDITKEEFSQKGEIVDIKIVDYKEAFRNPDKALATALSRSKNEEDKKRREEQFKSRQYAIITVRCDDTTFSESHGVPKGSKYDEKKNAWTVEDKLALKRSMSNLNNWFSKYNLKYGKDPQVGDKVEIKTLPTGFLRIAVVG